MRVLALIVLLGIAGVVTLAPVASQGAAAVEVETAEDSDPEPEARVASPIVGLDGVPAMSAILDGAPAALAHPPPVPPPER